MTLHGHTDSIRFMDFSPDGNYLASASFDKTAILWDVKNGKKWKTLKGHTHWVECIRFAPDGKTVVTSSADYSVRVWDVATGNQLAILKGHSDIVSGVDYSPDGKLLVSCSFHEIRLWNVKTGNEIKIATSSGADQMNCIAFSPTGKMLATGTGGIFSARGEVILWDAKTLTEKMRLKRHEGSVLCLTYSSDGSQLASGGIDSIVRVWNTKSGQQLYKRRMFVAAISSVSFAKNGRLAAGGSNFEGISVWDSKSRKSISVENNQLEWNNHVAISQKGDRIAVAKGKKILIRLLADNP